MGCAKGALKLRINVARMRRSPFKRFAIIERFSFEENGVDGGWGSYGTFRREVHTYIHAYILTEVCYEYLNWGKRIASKRVEPQPCYCQLYSS